MRPLRTRIARVALRLERGAHVPERVTFSEGPAVRWFAAIGEHRLKWGIVAGVVGTAAAAAIAWAAR